MKTLILKLLFMIPITCFAQREADNWFFYNKIALNFSSTTPTISYTTSNMCSYGKSATISDSLGNLLFYANNDTVWGKNHLTLPNGTGLMSLTNSQYIASGTQGVLLLKQPGNNNHYYHFNTGISDDQRLEYAIIDKSLNSGIGAVISKKNVLLHDSLTEKLMAVKHCNNKSIWVVAVKKSKIGHYCYFYSYLLNEFGLNPQPVISKVPITYYAPEMGQMKFNVQGNALAFACEDGIELFNFNHTSGIFNHQQTFSYHFKNGIGLEFSLDGKFIYVNNYQVNIATNSVYKYIDDLFFGPLQLNKYGQILFNCLYAYIYKFDKDNGAETYANIDYFNLAKITNPNNYGFACNVDTNYFKDYSFRTFVYSHSLPSFPNFYLFKAKSSFNYSGYCINTPLQFYNNQTGLDSLRWHFMDNGQTATNTLVAHSYTLPGNYEVQCIAYYNNTSDTSVQCVNIAGQGNSALPKTITICEGSDTIVNGLQPFGYNYVWNTGENSSALKIGSIGTYMLQYQTPCGNVTDTIQVSTVYCALEYQMPNVFTPNGDSVNDTLTISLKNTKEITYHIYNRWGVELKHNTETINVVSAQRVFLWDGTIQGNKASSGTYYYTIQLTPFKGELVNVKGFFNLFSD